MYGLLYAVRKKKKSTILIVDLWTFHRELCETVRERQFFENDEYFTKIQYKRQIFFWPHKWWWFVKNYFRSESFFFLLLLLHFGKFSIVLWPVWAMAYLLPSLCAPLSLTFRSIGVVNFIKVIHNNIGNHTYQWSMKTIAHNHANVAWNETMCRSRQQRWFGSFTFHPAYAVPSTFWKLRIIVWNNSISRNYGEMGTILLKSQQYK